MSRPVILLSLASLILFAACVDLRLPSKVSQCEKNDNCADRTDGATGGKGGATAGAGGSSRSVDAGVPDAPMAGRGGSGGIGGTSGGNTTGGSGGTTGGSGGKGGTGGAVTGGTGGSSSTGTEPPPDASLDEAISKAEVSMDTPPPEPDVIEPGPDTALVLDVIPDRPDTNTEALTCIQSFKANHYTLSVPPDGGPKGCSDCSYSEGACKAMIDCLVGVWVCKPSSGAGCWRDCRNYVGGDMVLDTCVSSLVTKACP